MDAIGAISFDALAASAVILALLRPTLLRVLPPHLAGPGGLFLDVDR